MFYLLLGLAGIIGGILAGLIGIGGGIIFVLVLPPALLMVGVPQAEIAQYVIANSLFATTVSSMVANVQLWKMGKFMLKPVLLISVPAIIASMIVIETVVTQPWYSAMVFNTLLFGLLLLMVLRTLLFKENTNNLNDGHNITIKQSGLVGLVTGMVQPLSGLGGGVVIIPMLNTFIRLPLKVANGISLGVVGLTSLINTVKLMGVSPNTRLEVAQTGYVVWPIAIAISIGVMLGSPFGVKWGQQLDQKYVRWLFVGFMSITLLKKGFEILSAL